MKRVLSTLFLSGLLGAAALAQTWPVQADIPFDFRVGKTELPRGRYILRNSDSGALQVRKADGTASVFVLTQAVERRAGPIDGKLVFNRYGTEYFLSQVWVAGGQTGRTIPPSKTELEIARSISSPHIVSTPAVASTGNLK